jgi:hypothetical protein
MRREKDIFVEKRIQRKVHEKWAIISSNENIDYAFLLPVHKDVVSIAEQVQ